MIVARSSKQIVWCRNLWHVSIVHVLYLPSQVSVVWEQALLSVSAIWPINIGQNWINLCISYLNNWGIRVVNIQTAIIGHSNIRWISVTGWRRSIIVQHLIVWRRIQNTYTWKLWVHFHREIRARIPSPCPRGSNNEFCSRSVALNHYWLNWLIRILVRVLGWANQC